MIPVQALGELMLEAARLCRDSFAGALSYRKSDGSLCTTADEVVEHHLLEGLKTLLPGAGICSEESGLFAGEEDLWIYVDPIDGTESYFAGLPTYAVCLAVFQGEECLYSRVELPAIHGFLEFSVENGLVIQAPTPIRARETGLILVPADFQKRILAPQGFKVRGLGSIAFHLTLLVRGLSSGVLIDSAKIWDVAALLPMLKDAGIQMHTIHDGVLQPDLESLHNRLQDLLFFAPGNGPLKFGDILDQI